MCRSRASKQSHALSALDNFLHHWRQRCSFSIYGLAGNIIAARQYEDTHQDTYVTYLSDFRGSITSIVDDGMNFVQGYRYTDYGITTRIGGGVFNEFAYTQGVWDEITGLYYLNARFYNPVDGRFLTQDPYRGSNDQPDTWHLYGYCMGNPINFIDPSGHRLTVPVAGSRTAIRRHLQRLTRFPVSINSNGVVRVDTSRANRRAGRALPRGNRLIRRMINHDRTATISLHTSRGHINAAGQTGGGNWHIFFAPNSDTNRVFTRISRARALRLIVPFSTSTRQSTPARIMFAHELIHVDRGWRWVRFTSGAQSDNRFRVLTGTRTSALGKVSGVTEVRTQTVCREDLAVIGLRHNVSGDITENGIRREQRRRLRTAY